MVGWLEWLMIVEDACVWNDGKESSYKSGKGAALSMT